MEEISNYIYLAAINYGLYTSGNMQLQKKLTNKDRAKIRTINIILSKAAKSGKINQQDKTIVNETILEAYKNAIKKEDFFHIIGFENYNWFKRNEINVAKISHCAVKWQDRSCQYISTYLFFRDYERFSLTINYGANFVKCDIFPNKDFSLSYDFTSSVMWYIKNFFKCA